MPQPCIARASVFQNQQIECAPEDVGLTGSHGKIGEQLRELLLGYERMSDGLLSGFCRAHDRPVEIQQNREFLSRLEIRVGWSDTSHRAEAAKSVFSRSCPPIGRRCNNP
jgi:hypothetical protein